LHCAEIEKLGCGRRRRPELRVSEEPTVMMMPPVDEGNRHQHGMITSSLEAGEEQ
jgi:hypothetical protein